MLNASGGVFSCSCSYASHTDTPNLQLCSSLHTLKILITATAAFNVRTAARVKNENTHS